MVRFQISLDVVEANALAKWAEVEMRDPRDQARYIIRIELERRGFIEIDPVHINGESGNSEEVTYAKQSD